MDVHTVHDHPVAALTAVVGSWVAWISAVAAQAVPVLQAASLMLAIVASCYAIRFYRKKVK